MSKTPKKRASRQAYISQGQLVIEGFESPFSQELDKSNRWVALADRLPWDELANLYLKKCPPKSTGRPPLNPRIVMGALIIKHLCNLDDRETISQITENIYMQYFLGYPGFDSQPPFDPSLFVEIRKRMGEDLINEMNMRILRLSKADKKKPEDPSRTSGKDDNRGNGDLLIDASVAPQDIAYPTDLNLLSEARQISERIIDRIYDKELHGKKPRTYRRVARKEYLKVAQSKSPGHKKIRRSVGKQLRYLRRNIKSIHWLLDSHAVFPMSGQLQRHFWVIQTLFFQQWEMYSEGKRSVDDRIVSIHQPHVRPIVRGKARARTEFGAKIHLSLVNGYAFLDTISWDAFNEGRHLAEYVEKYRERFGFYPERVLADKIYCTRENRKWLQERSIKLAAKPLGRPSAKAVEDHVRPGQRNPIEGKFGQAKNGYGMNRIRARLRGTSQSWIATIILVLNLVNLTREALLCLGFSARVMLWLRKLTWIYPFRIKYIGSWPSLRPYRVYNLNLAC